MGDDDARGGDAPVRWLLLIHQLPAKPASQRVRIWRRLQALGAVAVKHAVHALPANEHTREDFEWLLREIVAAGGEAMICEARLIDGLTDREVRAMFMTARDADYATLAGDARALAELIAGDSSAATLAEAKAKLVRLRTTAAQTITIDFFGANGRETVDGLLAALDTRLNQGPAMRAAATAPRGRHGHVWVTRRGVHVDRIASAWLIRRFIDRKARFKFVPGTGYQPQPGEQRFDMFEAEFTHEGDRCTFEVLLAHCGLTDPALVAIGEIVHDIDLKDGKFGREEVAGVANLVAGVSATAVDDEQRVVRGRDLFDGLYAFFSKKRG
jgi:hypothetical protein